MNPLTNIRNITKLNEREISLGISENASWHSEYKHSAWIFVGGLDFEMTEGDILAVFSQYGEVVNVNLVRDRKTGKSKGYCFLCYEDQRSTNLAVDNFNGIKLCHRTIRVDHVANYKIPKEDPNADIETNLLRDEGCAPNTQITTTRTEVVAKEIPKVQQRNETPKVKKERKDPSYDQYDIRRSEHQRTEEENRVGVSTRDTNREKRRDEDETGKRGSEHRTRREHERNKERSTSSKSQKVRSEHKHKSSSSDSSEERRRHRHRRNSTSSDSVEETRNKKSHLKKSKRDR